MKYPDDFNTPAFPAGRFVAVSRFMAVMVVIVFFVCVCLCGIIFWAKRSQSVSPFLISINPNGARWTTVSFNCNKTSVPAYYVLQESVLNKFIKNWFTISDNIFTNQANWSGECTRNSPECTKTTGDMVETCAIYCKSSDSVFDNFTKVVLPVFSKLETDDAAVWDVVAINVKPLISQDVITEFGGLWHINVFVNTGDDIVNFVGFARMAYDQVLYPKTMGYYVSEFNTYRMNQ